MKTETRGPGRPRKVEPTPTWAELRDVLKVPDVARYYDVDESTIYALVANEKCPIPVHRFGTAIRFSKYELAGIPQDILEKALLARDADRRAAEAARKAS